MEAVRIQTRQKRILALCAHLHEDGAAKQDHEWLQPMAGLHVASLIDRRRYAVSLYHEMWSGPFDTASIRFGEYAIVFLTELQMDFDRMRQLAFFFRRDDARPRPGAGMPPTRCPRWSEPSTMRSGPALASA
jgi:hypothetical protein